ncbi:MAG: plasmid pRiA4b ORF-3 family protein, partial [Acidimicrobiia bacterium]
MLAALSGAAGAIHLAMVPSHWGSSVVEGAGFALVGWAQIAIAVVLLASPSRWMNEFAFHGEWLWKEGQHDLEGLSLRMSSLIIGKLDEGSPDRALTAVAGGAEPLAEVIAFPGERAAPAPSAPAPTTGDVFQLKVTLLDTKPPIWRRVLIEGGSTLDHLHEVIRAAFGWWDYHLHEFAVGPVRYG